MSAAIALSLAACGRSSTEPMEPRLGMTQGPAGPVYDRQASRLAHRGSPEQFKAEAGHLVYFASDSSELLPEARQTLDTQARWLQQYGQQAITIEGHADERGTREYNIALGARRAGAVREYLVARGVDGRRIRTVSLGKERPVAVCNDISCWSRNRRAETVVSGAPVAYRW